MSGAGLSLRTALELFAQPHNDFNAISIFDLKKKKCLQAKNIKVKRGFDSVRESKNRIKRDVPAEPAKQCRGAGKT